MTDDQVPVHRWIEPLPVFPMEPDPVRDWLDSLAPGDQFEMADGTLVTIGEVQQAPENEHIFKVSFGPMPPGASDIARAEA